MLQPGIRIEFLFWLASLCDWLGWMNMTPLHSLDESTWSHCEGRQWFFSKQCSHGTFLELTYSCGTYRYKALPCNRLSSSNSVFQQVSLRRWLVLIHVMASNSADFSLNYNHYFSVCCYVVLMNPIMFASMTPILSFNYATWDAVWRINYG